MTASAVPGDPRAAVLLMDVLKTVEDVVGAPAVYDPVIGWYVPVGQWWRGIRMRRGRLLQVKWMPQLSAVQVTVYVHPRSISFVCLRPRWPPGHDAVAANDRLVAANTTAIISALWQEVAQKSRARRL